MEGLLVGIWGLLLLTVTDGSLLGVLPLVLLLLLVVEDGLVVVVCGLLLLLLALVAIFFFAGLLSVTAFPTGSGAAALSCSPCRLLPVPL